MLTARNFNTSFVQKTDVSLSIMAYLYLLSRCSNF